MLAQRGHCTQLHKEHRNKERRTEKRWYDGNGNKWVSEEEARQEDFDPNYCVEVQVDVDRRLDDYIETARRLHRIQQESQPSKGYKDDFHVGVSQAHNGLGPKLWGRSWLAAPEELRDVGDKICRLRSPALRIEHRSEYNAVS